MRSRNIVFDFILSNLFFSQIKKSTSSGLNLPDPDYTTKITDPGSGGNINIKR